MVWQKGSRKLFDKNRDAEPGERKFYVCGSECLRGTRTPIYVLTIAMELMEILSEHSSRWNSCLERRPRPWPRQCPRSDYTEAFFIPIANRHSLVLESIPNLSQAHVGLRSRRVRPMQSYRVQQIGALTPVIQPDLQPSPPHTSSPKARPENWPQGEIG